jgi:hypothetical protein
MRPVKRAAAALCLASVADLAAAGDAGPAQEAETLGLEVRTDFRDLDGRKLARIEAGKPFRLSAQFLETARSVPTAGLVPSGWLRKARKGQARCGEAARAFRATGRLSSSDIPLSGMSILSLGEDNSLAVIDPQTSLASSNIAALHRLGARPGSVLVHDGRGEVLVSLPDKGELVAIEAPMGKARRLAAGLARPTSLLDAPGGRVWVGDGNGGGALLLDADGRVARSVPVGGGAVVLRPVDEARALLIASDGSAALVARWSGDVQGQLRGGTIRLPAIATPDSILSAGADGGVVIRDLDALWQVRPIATRGRAGGMVADRKGRWAAIWSGSNLDLVDLARGQVVRGLTADEPVHEAVFASGSLFITYVTRPVVTVVDLGTLDLAGDTAIRDIRLAEGPGRPNPTESRLVSLEPASAVATIRPGSSTLFTVMGGGGVMAPMSAVAIRSSLPVAIAVQRRGMIEAEPGRYESVARLPSGGGWELVLTTGVGGTTACVPLQVAGVDPSGVVEPALSLITGRAAAGREQEVRLRLEGLERLASGATALVADLEGGWLRSVPVELESGRIYRLEVTLPSPGRYSIAVTDGSVKPVTLEAE